MSMSLRDQLIAAGLVTQKQAKQAQQAAQNAQRQQPKPRKNAPPALSEQAKAVQLAQAAKAARDAELNRKQQEKAERRARSAQIGQLIEQNKIPRVESDDLFNFVDGKKIRRIPVTAQMREQLGRNEVTLVRHNGRYDLVPAEIGEKIREREPRAVVTLNAAAPAPEQDDAYAAYKVPDDLMW